MAIACALCRQPIGTVFLEKIAGTFARDSDGKRKAVCSACQKARGVDSLRHT